MTDASPTPRPESAQKAPRKRRPPRRVEVIRIQDLGTAMRRITLHGTELEGFEVTAPASYMKLIFPEPGQTEPTRPLPDGPRATSMRTYTPLAVRPEKHEVDVDFVLHGDGPAATDQNGRTPASLDDMTRRDPATVARDGEGRAGTRLEGNVRRIDGDGGIERRDGAQKGALDLVRRGRRRRRVRILAQLQRPDHQRADDQGVDEPVRRSGETHGLSPSGRRRGSGRSTAWRRPEGRRRRSHRRGCAGAGR